MGPKSKITSTKNRIFFLIVNFKLNRKQCLSTPGFCGGDPRTPFGPFLSEIPISDFFRLCNHLAPLPFSYYFQTFGNRFSSLTAPSVPCKTKQNVNTTQPQCKTKDHSLFWFNTVALDLAHGFEHMFAFMALGLVLCLGKPGVLLTAEECPWIFKLA